MHYRMHQGERISEIGIGCYALSGAYGPKDPAAFIQMLRRAYELGVTLFDTADIYGPAEEILGQAVADFRAQVWIATKVGGGTEGKPDGSREHIVASCEQSLRRLQADCIDLYQIHFSDPHTPVEETVAALDDLQAAGKIRHYGVGHLSLPSMVDFFSAGEIFSALVELSGAARSARKQVLPLCREQDVGVIAFSTTGRGLLSGAIGPGHTFAEGDIRQIDPLFQRERFASGLRVLERFRALGQRYDKTPVQVAIAWVLAQPGVICALTGPSTIPHLEENVAASGWAIPPEDLAALEQFFAQEEKWLAREQLRSLHKILEQPLDPEHAFTDLVYVLETLIEAGQAEEADLLPLFQRLLSIREQGDTQRLPEMRAIQEALKTHLPATPPIESREGHR